MDSWALMVTLIDEGRRFILVRSQGWLNGMISLSVMQKPWTAERAGLPGITPC